MKCWTAEEMEAQSVDLREVETLVDMCCALLARKHPGVQGAALAELLALWLLGYDAEEREEQLANHIRDVRELIEGRD
jgi:hypothetical protein